MGFMFEKLDAYQKAVELAEVIFKITAELPKGNR